MKYLLLVGHAALADGVRSALEMLMGARDNVLSCGLDEGESPEEFRARLSALLEPLAPTDQVILLSDIAGGSPQKTALDVLSQRRLAGPVVAFGGLNLPMAISALMAMEDDFDLDSLRDAVLADGEQAVRQI